MPLVTTQKILLLSELLHHIFICEVLDEENSLELCPGHPLKVHLVRVLHVPSSHQFADIFTKGLPAALFQDFVSSLNFRRSTVSTAGGC